MKHFNEKEAREICADPIWAQLQKRLHECGLHQTGQELNKVTQTLGWELAERLKKSQRKTSTQSS